MFAHSPTPERRRDSPPSPQRQEQQPEGQPNNNNTVNPDEPCPDCSRLLADLRAHIMQDHAGGLVHIQKMAIRTWFECHYTKNSGEAGENPTKVPRKTLLQEINHFLHHMEWQQWKAQSNMYKDWFLPVVMGVDANTHAKGRPWSLYKRNGFAPAGDVGNARNREQAIQEISQKIHAFL